MKRREALKAVSLIFKVTVVAPGILSTVSGCKDKGKNTGNLNVLNSDENALVCSIIDIIIPPTSTPGASALKVNEFIDLVLKDVAEPGVKSQFLNGLKKFDDQCVFKTGESFPDLDKEGQFRYLNEVDKQVMRPGAISYNSFYFILKQLTLIAYFSTKEGIKSNLNYMPVPGPYFSDIEMQEDEKIIKGNHFLRFPYEESLF